MATYTVYRAPIPLYYDSYLAEQKSTYKTSTLKSTGTYTILNSRKGSDGVMLYGFNIGWIRDDDNYVPSSVNTFADLTTIGTTTLNINRIANTMTHKLVIKVNNVTVKTIENVATSTTLSFNATELNQVYNILNNSILGTLTVVCYTYINGSQIGSYKATNGKILVDESIVPKFNANPTVTIVNPYGSKAYQNHSSVTINATNVSAGQGASIKSTSISVGSFISNSNIYTTPVLNTSGTIPIKVIITDSRSRTATYKSDLVVTPYFGLRLSNFNATRISTTETSISIMMASDASLSAPSYKLEYKAKNGNTWTELTGLTLVAIRQGDYVVKTKTTVFNKLNTYDLRFVATDAINNTVTGFATISGEQLPLSVGRHGIAIGKAFSETDVNDLQVGTGGASIEGTVQINKNDNALQLKGLSRVFQELFIGGVRKGYLGFPIIGSNNLSIANEAIGMTLDLGKELTYGGEILARSKLVTNANGSYFRFGDLSGLTIAWNQFTIPRTAGQARVMPPNKPKPIVFKNGWLSYAGMSTKNSDYQAGIDMAALTVLNYDEAWRITGALESGNGVWKGSGDLHVTVFCIGFT